MSAPPDVLPLRETAPFPPGGPAIPASSAVLRRNNAGILESAGDECQRSGSPRPGLVHEALREEDRPHLVVTPDQGTNRGSLAILWYEPRA